MEGREAHEGEELEFGGTTVDRKDAGQGKVWSQGMVVLGVGVGSR